MAALPMLRSPDVGTRSALALAAPSHAGDGSRRWTPEAVVDTTAVSAATIAPGFRERRHRLDALARSVGCIETYLGER